MTFNCDFTGISKVNCWVKTDAPHVAGCQCDECTAPTPQYGRTKRRGSSIVFGSGNRLGMADGGVCFYFSVEGEGSHLAFQGSEWTATADTPVTVRWKLGKLAVQRHGMAVSEQKTCGSQTGQCGCRNAGSAAHACNDWCRKNAGCDGRCKSL